MRHFTAARYLNLGRLDDEQQFLAAQSAWEEAVVAYRDQLQRIRKQLPRGLVRLVTTVYLHDARVLAMHQSEQDFLITLHPISTPSRLAVIGYSLVEEPTIMQGVLPSDHCRDPIVWLYDELDLDRPEGPRGLPDPSGKPTYRHDILLSNGWEVRLRFRSAWVKQPLGVLPVGPEGNTVGSRSA